jgi:hypothetical protein
MSSTITLTRRSRGASQEALLPLHCTGTTKRAAPTTALAAVLGVLSIVAVAALCLSSSGRAASQASGSVVLASDGVSRALEEGTSLPEAAPLDTSAPGPSFTSKAPCRDLSKDCKAWAATGECGRNGRFMNHMCPASCLKCDAFDLSRPTPDQAKHAVVSRAVAALQGDTAADQLDSNTACPGWAATGECLENPKFMLRECHHACSSIGHT